jgi:hypothetical protein
LGQSGDSSRTEPAMPTGIDYTFDVSVITYAGCGWGVGFG